MGASGTLIYLLRHGAVVHAETGRFIGHLDVPLSELGERQIAAQAARLASRQISAIYASDLIRARRSGEIVGTAHGLVPTVVPALREMAMGRWDGLTAGEIQRREPERFADWMSRVGEFPFPDGECVSDLEARAWPALVSIIGKHRGEAIVVVAHGGTNRTLLCRALGLPRSRLLSLGQDYGALTVLDSRGGAWRLQRLNERPAL